MKKSKISFELKECAELFYQNNEQMAYARINEILPQMNQKLQELVQLVSNKTAENGENLGENVVQSMKKFVSAYQVHDTLALADLLDYTIAEEIRMLEEEN